MYKIKCDSCQALAANGHATHESGCNGTMIFIKNGREYRKYRVYSLDVWGNAREGFEVNDRSQCGSVMVPASLDDKAIVRALKAAGLLRKGCHTRSFSIDGDETMFMVDAARTSEPIYQLEAI